MKTKKITTKLTLNKTTISVLEQNQQTAVRGGYYWTAMFGGTECRTWHPICWTKPIYQCAVSLDCHLTD